MELTLAEEPVATRFTAYDGETMAGFVEYIRTDAGLIVFTHTEVDRAYEGKGVGSTLARHVLDVARARHLKVLPICPFISGWITRHPEYRDVLYTAKPSTATD